MKYQFMLARDLLKLRVRRGFSLIEIMCSISIFSILFLAATIIQLNTISLKKYNYEVNKYVSYIEGLKNLIIYNTSYEDIINLCNTNESTVFYIDKDKIDSNILKSNSMFQIISKNVENNEPYIILTVYGAETEGETLKIDLKMNSKILNKNELFECNFYKGNYS